MVVMLFFVIRLIKIIMTSDAFTSRGIVQVTDFLNAWLASRTAFSGHADWIYSPAYLQSLVLNTAPHMRGYGSYVSILAWLYPPTFYLVVLPFGLLSYNTALALFMAITLVLYIVTLSRVLNGHDAWIALLGFSGLWINLLHGQNAFLLAALMGSGIMTLRRAPLLSGLFFGLATIKPQLVILIPVVLVASRSWCALISMGTTSLGFMTVAVAILGKPSFFAWLDNLSFAHAIVETGHAELVIASVFSFLSLLGMPSSAGYVIQGITAMLAVGLVWYVWRRTPSIPLRGSTLICSTMMVSPYLFYYDLALLAWPIAWMAQHGLQYGWKSGDREILATTWLLPAMVEVNGWYLKIPFQPAPLVVLAFLWVIVRHVHQAAPLGHPPTSNRSF